MFASLGFENILFASIAGFWVILRLRFLLEALGITAPFGQSYVHLGIAFRHIFLIEYSDIRIKQFNSSPSYFHWEKLNWKAVLPV